MNDAKIIFSKRQKIQIIMISLLFGLLGSLFISAIFFITMTVFASFSAGIDILKSLFFWMIPLIAGFGIQAGLFSYMKQVLNQKNAMLSATASVSASGGMSAVSMLACCAHHFTDILPFLGVTALAAFFLQFQQLFLAIGISSNIVGIFLMLKNIVTHELFIEGGMLSKLKGLNMNYLFNVSIIFSVSFSLFVLIKTLIQN
jgi:hypothetical protein